MEPRECLAGVYCVDEGCKLAHPDSNAVVSNPGIMITDGSFYGDSNSYSYCGCCGGDVFCCLDFSEICGNLGICICQCADNEEGMYSDDEFDQFEEAYNESLEPEEDPSTFWFPDAKDCSCCTGYKLHCGTCNGKCKCYTEETNVTTNTEETPTKEEESELALRLAEIALFVKRNPDIPIFPSGKELEKQVKVQLECSKIIANIRAADESYENVPKEIFKVLLRYPEQWKSYSTYFTSTVKKLETGSATQQRAVMKGASYAYMELIDTDKPPSLFLPGFEFIRDVYGAETSKKFLGTIANELEELV